MKMRNLIPTLFAMTLAVELSFGAGNVPSAPNSIPVSHVFSVGKTANWLSDQGQGGNTYLPKNVLDRDLNTAWAVPYQKDGEYILQLNPSKAGAKVQTIEIFNGYGKSKDAFKKNRRAKKIAIYANGLKDGNKIATITLRDQMDGQVVAMPASALAENVDMLFIKILSTYKGSKWDDLCISEIALLGIEGKGEGKGDELYTEPIEQISRETVLKISDSQVETLSKRRYVILTKDQKKLIHPKFKADTIWMALPNAMEGDGGDVYGTWTGQKDFVIPPLFAAGDNPDVRSYNVYSNSIILGLDGRLYRDGKEVSVDRLVKEQKANPPMDGFGNPVIGVDPCDGGEIPGLSLPPETVRPNGMDVNKIVEDLEKSGLNFCYN